MAHETLNSPLNYQIYTSVLRTNIWGDGVSGTSVGGTILIQLGGSVVTRIAYGSMQSGQNVRSGTYGDTVVVSFVF
mgnify:FL=1